MQHSLPVGRAGLRFTDLLPAVRAAVGRFALAGLLPIATFYVLYRIAGPLAGILGGMTLSLFALSVQLRRLRRLDPVVLVPMGVILVQGSAALLLDSVELYLAAPAVENTIWGVALVGSSLGGRPLVTLIAGELGLLPAVYARSDAVRRALRHLTLAWGLAAFLRLVSVSGCCWSCRSRRSL
jgi:intracellular septation protein A